MVGPFGDAAGGIAGLGQLIRDHGAAAEASLRAVYGVQLGDLFTGRLTCRQLIVYLRHLPADSALGIALHGDAARWGVGEHLLAMAVDVLVGANWQRGGGKGQKPKPIPRPDPRAERRKRDYVQRLQRMGLIKAEG